MKIAVTSKAKNVQIGESSLNGKCLVGEDDKVGHTCYDVVFEAGANQGILSAYGQHFNHVYYCVYGEIEFQCSEGTTATLKADHLIALTGQMKAMVRATSKTRLFIIYVREAQEGSPQKAFYYTMDRILGTERDVDWFHGRSRRFLRRAEGFNISVHNTLCYSGNPPCTESKT